MFFIHLLPFFAIIAYYDYKQRDIPQWIIALTWLVYALSFTFVHLNTFDYFLATFLPIACLGIFWVLQVFIEKLHKIKWNPKMVKCMRIGLGDVFVLPLMFPLVAQTGFYSLIWLPIASILGIAWYSFIKKGSWQHRHNIPYLLFALISMILMFSLDKGMVISKWL